MDKQGQGYDGYSMSVNARISYENAEVPLSAINTELLQELKINETVVFIKNLMERLGRTSYHHTGKHYNRTDFYELNRYHDLDSKELEEFKQEFKELKKLEKQEKQEKQKSWYYAKIKYIEFEGSRRYPKKVEHEEYCIIIENWAHISENTKKNIKGNYILSIDMIGKGKRKPKEMNNKTRDKIFKKYLK